MASLDCQAFKTVGRIFWRDMALRWSHYRLTAGRIWNDRAGIHQISLFSAYTRACTPSTRRLYKIPFFPHAIQPPTPNSPPSLQSITPHNDYSFNWATRQWLSQSLRCCLSAALFCEESIHLYQWFLCLYPHARQVSAWLLRLALEVPRTVS